MNENQTSMKAIIDIAMAIAKNPGAFYRTMPKTGGYVAPMLFVIVMSVLAGCILFAYFLLGFGVLGSAVGFGAILMTVLFALLGSFISAAIMYVIWKLMGSNENYETAYRCIAYAAVTYPVSALLGPIPYIGAVIAILLGFYLMVLASTEVHGLEKRTAYLVLGILAILVIISQISNEIASRRMAATAEQFAQQFKGLENVDEMTPEQAGKALGEFLKGLREATKDTN